MPLERQDQCCGFWRLVCGAVSGNFGAMVADKVACVTNTKADVLVSTETGCLMNIGGALHRQKLPTRNHALGRVAGMSLIVAVTRTT